MGTIRFFDGGRDQSKRNLGTVGGDLMRLQLKNKGKMSAPERYKYIFSKKMEESKKKLAQKTPKGFLLPGTIQQARKMSKPSPSRCA